MTNRIYIGRLPECGCAVAATIDGDDLAEFARNGYTVETVIAESIQIAGCQCGEIKTASASAAELAIADQDSGKTKETAPYLSQNSVSKDSSESAAPTLDMYPRSADFHAALSAAEYWRTTALKERERCANIALAIDSGRGNEKEIAAAIRNPISQDRSGLPSQDVPDHSPASLPLLPYVCSKCGVQQHASGICANCGSALPESQRRTPESWKFCETCKRPQPCCICSADASTLAREVAEKIDTYYDGLVGFNIRVSGVEEVLAIIEPYIAGGQSVWDEAIAIGHQVWKNLSDNEADYLQGKFTDNLSDDDRTALAAFHNIGTGAKYVITALEQARDRSRPESSEGSHDQVEYRCTVGNE